jgi:5-oxoprolinase (ATP-hydrolysing) subunit A
MGAEPPILNADLGEGTFEMEQSMLPHLGLVNVACGGHAGDVESMHALLEAALKHPLLLVGAHPSYPDRVNFGRQTIGMDFESLRDSLVSQLSSLLGIAQTMGIRITHCKAHGALYHTQLFDDEAFEAVLAAMEVLGKGSILLLPAGPIGDHRASEVLARGFRVWRESFADRRYLADGSIMGRQHADAMIVEPASIVDQAFSLMNRSGVATHEGDWITLHSDTVCLHGDHPPSRAAASLIAGISMREDGRD